MTTNIQARGQQTIYDKIGGKAALAAVVDEFYRRVLGDGQLAPLFAKTDMQRQRAHQIAFLATALGGPSEYTGRSMRAAHTGRGITDMHFGLVSGHLLSTLEWAKVGGAEIDRILATAGSLHDDVVGH